MPTYDFLDTSTNEYVSIFMTMAEREAFIEKYPDMQQLLVKPVANIDPLMLGRLNAKGKDFQRNIVDRMKHSIHGNKLDHSRFGHNIKEI